MDFKLNVIWICLPNVYAFCSIPMDWERGSPTLCAYMQVYPHALACHTKKLLSYTPMLAHPLDRGVYMSHIYTGGTFFTLALRPWSRTIEGIHAVGPYEIEFPSLLWNKSFIFYFVLITQKSVTKEKLCIAFVETALCIYCVEALFPNRKAVRTLGFPQT